MPLPLVRAWLLSVSVLLGQFLLFHREEVTIAWILEGAFASGCRVLGCGLWTESWIWNANALSGLSSQSSDCLGCLNPMGSLAPSHSDEEDYCSNIYSVLDLKESETGLCESPRVLSILASLLQTVVDKNQKIRGNGERKIKMTVFHGIREPPVSIRSYIERIFKYSNCSPSCFILAYAYIDRFMHQQPDVLITSLNVHRLLITSVMVAAKFLDDAFLNNAYYAKIGGISTSEMNRLELEFLFNLDFKLQLTVDCFESYCLRLEKEVALGGGYQVERPLKSVCGINGINNKEEHPGQSIATKCTYGAV